MKVKEIMVKEVATLDVNDELSLANDIMRLGRIRHLPVVDGTRLVGIVSERDLFRRSLAQALGYASKDTRDLMKTLRIKDVMVTGVITISSGHRVVRSHQDDDRGKNRLPAGGGRQPAGGPDHRNRHPDAVYQGMR